MTLADKYCTIRHLNSCKGENMSDFLSEVQSDELAECVDYQEWIDLRRLETIESMEQEAENE